MDHRRWLSAAGAMLLAAGWLRAAPPAGLDTFTGEATVLLSGALEKGSKDKPSPADLELYLRCRDGKWQADVLGWSQFFVRGEMSVRSYNAVDHEGQLTRAGAAGGEMKLAVAMDVGPDYKSLPGGPADYQITLRRDGDLLSGAYKGTFGDVPREGKASGTLTSGFWPPAAKGFEPLKADEHPRLIFRAANLAELRRKAATPEGKAILARLRELLGGRFTLWHAAGRGLLYQLDGDKTDADKARALVDRIVVERAKDELNRGLWWGAPEIANHAPAVAAVALAYDLAGAGWDADYRRRIAGLIEQEMMFLIRGGGREYEPCARMGGYALQAGCAALAALSIIGDARDHLPPETKSLALAEPAVRQRVAEWKKASDAHVAAGSTTDAAAWALRIATRRLRRVFSDAGGFGDHGFSHEGDRFSRTPVAMGLLPAMVAFRSAAGADLAGAVGGQWLLLRRAMECLPTDKGCVYPARDRYGGGVAPAACGGDFATGFGLCPEDLRPAALWCWKRWFGAPAFDIALPHQAAHAMAGWPIGVKEARPEGLLPLTLHDRRMGYFVFRSGWRDDANDNIATLHLSRTGGAMGGLPLVVWALGGAYELTPHDVSKLRPGGPPPALDRVLSPFSGLAWYGMDVAGFEAAPDGASVVAMTQKTPGAEHKASVAVDYSGLSGSLVLIAVADVWKRQEAAENPAEAAEIAALLGTAVEDPTKAPPRVETTAAGRGAARAIMIPTRSDRRFQVVTFQAGQPPAFRVEGRGLEAAVTVGRRTVRFDGARIVLGK